MAFQVLAAKFLPFKIVVMTQNQRNLSCGRLVLEVRIYSLCTHLYVRRIKYRLATVINTIPIESELSSSVCYHNIRRRIYFASRTRVCIIIRLRCGAKQWKNKQGKRFQKKLCIVIISIHKTVGKVLGIVTSVFGV